MAETTDAILAHLRGKSPQQIEQTLKNLGRMSEAQAEEKGVIAARQAAEIDAMTLDEVGVKLNKANANADFEEVKKWEPIHKQKLQWDTDQKQAA